MGFFSKPKWQNPKHLAQNIAHQQPWKPQNPSHTLQGMNNVIGDENAGEGQGFSPELQAQVDANHASGNVGTPGRRPGMIYDHQTGQYTHAPNSQGLPGIGKAVQGVAQVAGQAGINPRLAPRTYPAQQMGTPGRRNAGAGSPGMRPKGDGRTNPNVNRVFGMLR